MVANTMGCMEEAHRLMIIAMGYMRCEMSRIKYVGESGPIITEKPWEHMVYVNRNMEESHKPNEGGGSNGISSTGDNRCPRNSGFVTQGERYTPPHKREDKVWGRILPNQKASDKSPIIQNFAVTNLGAHPGGCGFSRSW